MGKTITNLVIALGVAIIAVAGYFMYKQQASSVLNFSVDEQTMQTMLNSTRSFIEYRHTLEQIKLDTSFFEDKRFLSLHSFSTDVMERPVGRENPFAEPTAHNTTAPGF